MSEWQMLQQHRWDEEDERKARNCPICKWCGEPIRNDYAYEINGVLVCEDCIKDAKVWIDD